MQETIDVLLATYNGEKYIKEQIDRFDMEHCQKIFKQRARRRRFVSNRMHWDAKSNRQI